MGIELDLSDMGPHCVGAFCGAFGGFHAPSASSATPPMEACLLCFLFPSECTSSIFQTFALASQISERKSIFEVG